MRTKLPGGRHDRELPEAGEAENGPRPAARKPTSLLGRIRPMTDQPIYALNLFDIADRDEYLAHARRAATAVEEHGGRVIALGRFSDEIKGNIAPRQVLILVEWKSRAHFDGYREDPELADLHPHREAGGGNYVWHLFDKLDDLRPLLG